MRVYSCYFGNGRFEAMAKALEASLRLNAPGALIQIERVAAPPDPITTYNANTEKLSHWQEQVDSLDQGECLALLDSDTLVLRSLGEAFYTFKTAIAVTLKDSSVKRMRYNCGVVFVRGGEEASAFFRKWVWENKLLFSNRALHIPFEQRYGGMNQAAFGKMIEDRATECDAVTELPCYLWNACYPLAWASALAEAHVVHYKSDLRQAIWSHGKQYPGLVAEWRKYERLANGKNG